MAHEADRRTDRRFTDPVSAGTGTAEDALNPRFLALAEEVGEAPGEPGEPAGFGTEASRSTQSFAEFGRYDVPEGRIALVQEVSLSIESNGEARVHMNGVTYGGFTGAVDVTLQLGGAVLFPHQSIVVSHQSTDGTSTTTKAFATVQEI